MTNVAERADALRKLVGEDVFQEIYAMYLLKDSIDPHLAVLEKKIEAMREALGLKDTEPT